MNRLIAIVFVGALLVLLFPLMFFSGDLPTSRYAGWKDFAGQFVHGQFTNQTQHSVRAVNHMVYSREEKQILPSQHSEDVGLHDVDAFWLARPTRWRGTTYPKGQIFRMCDFARVTLTQSKSGEHDEISPSWTLQLCEWKHQWFPSAGHATGVFATEAEAFALPQKAKRVLNLK